MGPRSRSKVSRVVFARSIDTYPGGGRGANVPPRHVFERRIGGENVLCVLIDSVQSQANRLEEALGVARETGALSFPTITVDFSNTEIADIGRITTLDAPHRVFDAIIRDSELNGIRFRYTEQGRRLIEAKAHNARAIYELSPTALVWRLEFNWRRRRPGREVSALRRLGDHRRGCRVRTTYRFPYRRSA